MRKLLPQKSPNSQRYKFVGDKYQVNDLSAFCPTTAQKYDEDGTIC